MYRSSLLTFNSITATKGGPQVIRFRVVITFSHVLNKSLPPNCMCLLTLSSSRITFSKYQIHKSRRHWEEGKYFFTALLLMLAKNYGSSILICLYYLPQLNSNRFL